MVMRARASAAGPATTVLAPPRAWRGLDAAEVWRHRDLLVALAIRDVRLRYRPAVLGVAWALLQPMALTGLLTLVLGRVAGVDADGAPYPLFALAGLLVWGLFAGVVANGTASLVGQAHLVGKVYLPRLVIPLAAAASPLVDFAVGLVLLLALLPVYGTGIGLSVLALPVLTAGVLVAGAGLGIGLSALAVAYRDVRHGLPVVLQLGLFATPVVYPASLLPEAWRWLLRLNPLTGFVEGFRAALLGQALDWGAIALSWAMAVALLLAGLGLFARLERQLADDI